MKIVGGLGFVSTIIHLFTPESPIFLDPNTSPTSPDTGLKKKTSVKDFWRDSTLFVNIVVMVLIWSTTSAGFYLINFNMKYFGGTIINNVYALVGSEIVSALVASVFFELLGVKPALLTFFFISGISGVLTCLRFTSSFVITMLVLVSKFGVAAAY